MFDGGECKVRVLYQNGEKLNATMGKGDTSDAMSWTLRGYSASAIVGVSALGVVTLETDIDNFEGPPNAGDFGGWEVDVHPQYDVSALETRAANISGFYATDNTPQGNALSGNDTGGEGGEGGG
jgi:hypothetical protein